MLSSFRHGPSRLRPGFLGSTDKDHPSKDRLLRKLHRLVPVPGQVWNVGSVGSWRKVHCFGNAQGGCRSDRSSLDWRGI